ncbi:hypothetical protein ACWGHM_15310 [Streptomyces sp. NPDC054904]
MTCRDTLRRSSAAPDGESEETGANCSKPRSPAAAGGTSEIRRAWTWGFGFGAHRQAVSGDDATQADGADPLSVPGRFPQGLSGCVVAARPDEHAAVSEECGEEFGGGVDGVQEVDGLFGGMFGGHQADLTPVAVPRARSGRPTQRGARQRRAASSSSASSGTAEQQPATGGSRPPGGGDDRADDLPIALSTTAFQQVVEGGRG